MTPTLTTLSEWDILQDHKKTISHQRMQDWFLDNPHRFEKFSLKFNELMLDYSKNYITGQTLSHLIALANAVHLPQKIEQLFTGGEVNSTEKRPALHTALRDRQQTSLLVGQTNVMPDIHATLDHMREFSDKIRNQTWRGATGKPIQDIVNIGIGGSHLGPLMTTRALSEFAMPELNCHFISNIDSAHIHEVLTLIDPETTLFIISSKSFSTLETITNAATIKAWLQTKLPTSNLEHHMVAITAAKEKAIAFGIPEQQIFNLWNWVGGRYSIWSAIGLPLAIMIGMDHFTNFLDGAYAMDQHFRHSEFAHNMPVIMALLDIWYSNFFDVKAHAIIPYSHALTYFRAHLQQLDMESNGKHVAHHGEALPYQTGAIIWGEQGCNGQHAFHQLFHQGQHIIPIDFILVGKSQHAFDQQHQDILVASGLSQAQALMCGKSFLDAKQELLQEGYSAEEADFLAKHKSVPGNRPSNILFLDQITPYNVGALIALYEHKTFVQGAIWNINSFDQWGVELGKQLLPYILADLRDTEIKSHHDASTQGLINHYRAIRKNS